MSTRTHLAIALLPFTAIGCSTPQIALTPEYSLSKLDGHFGASTSSVSAQSSFDDLGLDEQSEQLGGRVDLKWGLPHLSVSYAESSFSGDGTATAQLTQGGVTIPAGASVDSSLDLDIASAVLTFDLLPSDTAEAGIGFGIQGLDFQGSVRDTGSGQSVDTSEMVPIPVIAVRASAEIWRIEASALIAGSKVSFNGDDLSYYDVDLQGRLRIFEHGWLALGWRQVHVDLQYDDGGDAVDADLTLKGPYLGFVLSF